MTTYRKGTATWQQWFAVVVLASAQCSVVSGMENSESATGDLARMSLEELGSIIVTSVSKKPERLSDAAASIYVITRDDIRRSGVTSLPEALRLAPNLQVARTSSSGYAISARGFNGTSANTLLVLIDGRSVYSPLFSGVFWDVQDVMLEDIERIEVVSGSGGTLWGINAVNGVINIITRSAKDTQGGLASVGDGSQEADSSLRYGGSIGDGSGSGNFRIYAKTFDRDHTEIADGSPVNDGWHQTQAGFRADWEWAGDRLTAEGDAYRGQEAQPAPGEISVTSVNIPLGDVSTSGENLTTHWDHRLDSGGDLNVTAYLDRAVRTVNPTFADTLNLVDLQVQHALPPIGMQAFTWGAEYRYGMDNVVNSQYVAFLPASLNQAWASLFAQDELALRANLQLTVGARVERNDYTGNEFLPNVRLAWKSAADDLLWAAISRTVRAPSRLDHDIFIPGNPPYLLAGGPDVVSEVAKVFEIGYRGQPSPRFSYSATLFHAIYDHLLTATLAPDDRSLIFSNGMEGATSGVEMWGNYQVMQSWRLSAGLSGLREKLQFYPGEVDQFSTIGQGSDPAQWWSLRSSFDLPRQTELDVFFRHVGALSDPVVPAYSTLGFRVGWNPYKNLECSVTAQNLIGSGHGEFADVSTRSEFGRSVFFKAVARF